MRETFGEKLGRILDTRNMTTSEFAKKSKMHYTSINDYLNERNLPSKRSVEKIANGLGCTVESLVQGTEIEYRFKSKSIFRKNLRSMIDSCGLSVNEFSKRSGVCVYGYLKEKCLPDAISLEMLCKYLGVNEEEFFKEELVNKNQLPSLQKHEPIEKLIPEPSELQEIPHRAIGVGNPLVVSIPNQSTCTKCMYDNVTDCVVNSMFSYSPDTIQKWARRSICRMTDIGSVDYDPDRAIVIQEMLFNFFINKKKPLRPDSRYFIREKNGQMFLKRNKGELDTLHNYTISRTDENGKTHVTRSVMTEAEKSKVEDVLNELSIDFIVRDLADVLK